MPRTDLLRQLAAHLRSDHRAHPIFDFNFFNSGYSELTPNVCGTRGCAVGECPAIWPEVWKWRRYDVVATITAENGKPYNVENYEAAAYFFQITMNDSHFLFGGYECPLNSDATAEDVADHIEKFCLDIEAI